MSCFEVAFAMCLTVALVSWGLRVFISQESVAHELNLITVTIISATCGLVLIVYWAIATGVY